MSTEQMKEVHFGTYCGHCISCDTDPSDEPCYECLSEGMQSYSHVPIKYNWDPKRGADPKPKKKERKD